MDAKDHAKIAHHSGQEGHGVHVCHKCGWPFPNPHPSAKHRRAHKRHCGKVEGYKLVHTEGSTHSAVSDDEDHHSDDDHKTPSPKIVETSKHGIGSDGIGERSNRMEDEVFSDAVTEFSDSGISPGIGQGLEDARESTTNVEKVAKDGFDDEQPFEDNPIMDTIQPPGSLTDSSMMQIPGVPTSKNDFLESPIMPQDQAPYSSLGSVARPISEDFAKESTLGLSGDGNDSSCNLSAIKPETPTEAPQEDYKTNAGEGIMECPLSGNIGEAPMALIGQKPDAMKIEEKILDRKFLEIAVSSNESAGETSEAVLKSEKTAEETSDPVAGDVIVQSEEDQTGGGPKISPTSSDIAHDQAVTAPGAYCASVGILVEAVKAKGEENENILVLAGKLPDSAASMSEDTRETFEVGSISEKIDVKPLDPVPVDGIAEVKEDQSGGVVFKSSPRDLYPEPKSFEQTDASADTAQGLNLAGSCGLVDSFKAKGEKNEALLSEPDGIHSVDNPQIMVEYFNDHDVVKSNLPMTLDSCGLIKDIGDNTTEYVSEENRPGIQSRQLARCTDAFPSDVRAFDDNLKQDDVCRNPTVPVESKAGVSKIKVAICENPGLDDLDAPAEHSWIEMDKNQTICSLAEQESHDSSKESLGIQLENVAMVLPKTMASPIDSEICENNSVDDNSGGDHDKARSENYDMAGSAIAEGAAEDNITENRKTASECVRTSNSQANQTLNPLEGDSAGDLDKIKMEACEIARREGTEGSKEENNALGGESAGNHEKVEIKNGEVTEKESKVEEENIVMNTSEITSSLSEFRVDTEDDMNAPVRNLPETEYKSLVEVSDPSRVEIDITETHSSLQNQDKGSQELEVSNHNEIKLQCLGAVSGVAQSNPVDEKLSQNAETQPIEEPKLKPGDFEFSVQCLTLVEEDQAKMFDGEASNISSSMREPMHLSGDAELSVQSSATVEDDCTGLLAADASVISSSTKEPKPSSFDDESSVQRPTKAVEDDQVGGSAPAIKSETLLVEGDKTGIDRQHGFLPVDVSIDSGSQTDSLEGNWGSVSGLSTQSDALAPVGTNYKAAPKSERDTLNKPNLVSVSHGSDKSDVFEPPSFATLVEPAGGGSGLRSAPEIQTIQSQQQPKSAPSQAGWFPSLTNVVNESQGRKKNEEAIAKVTNWSTGKQHIPLKTLLVEATTETKPKSPTPKENAAAASAVQKDEAPVKNGSAPPPTAPEAPTTTEPAKDLGKEWNSPARYPIDSKRDKRKGRPYWAPFVCCSSVN